MTLNEAVRIESQGQTLPAALPAVHLTIARWFEGIVKDCVLVPRMCKVFQEEVLYFFYGGVFFRFPGRH